MSIHAEIQKQIMAAVCSCNLRPCTGPQLAPQGAGGSGLTCLQWVVILKASHTHCSLATCPPGPEKATDCGGSMWQPCCWNLYSLHHGCSIPNPWEWHLEVGGFAGGCLGQGLPGQLTLAPVHAWPPTWGSAAHVPRPLPPAPGQSILYQKCWKLSQTYSFLCLCRSCSCTQGTVSSWQAGWSLRVTATLCWGSVNMPALPEEYPGPDPPPGLAVDGNGGASGGHVGMVGRRHRLAGRGCLHEDV